MTGSDVGFIWDIDGVVIDSPQEEAWRTTLKKEPWSVEKLSSDFYFTHVASRPRHEGAHNILQLKGIYERLGAITEEEKRELAERYAGEKDALIQDLMGRGEFRLFADAVWLLLQARGRGVRQAAASASKNASRMLKNTPRSRVVDEVGDDFGTLSDGDTLYSLFDVDACGIDVAGKAEILRLAAGRLVAVSGGRITSFVVFEDAPSGLEAARSLGYCGVGVLRIGAREALEQAGAEIVTEDLRSISVEELLEKR